MGALTPRVDTFRWLPNTSLPSGQVQTLLLHLPRFTTLFLVQSAPPRVCRQTTCRQHNCISVMILTKLISTSMFLGSEIATRPLICRIQKGDDLDKLIGLLQTPNLFQVTFMAAQSQDLKISCLFFNKRSKTQTFLPNR